MVWFFIFILCWCNLIRQLAETMSV
jgi:hypothetical protein